MTDTSLARATVVARHRSARVFAESMTPTVAATPSH